MSELSCDSSSLLCERVYYLYGIYPRRARTAVRLWEARDDKSSWYALQYRDHLRHRIAAELNRNFSMIGTIIKICPYYFCYTVLHQQTRYADAGST